MSVAHTIRLLETAVLPTVGDSWVSRKGRISVIDFGSWPDMKGKYPEAAEAALRALTRPIPEEKLGRTWVLRSLGTGMDKVWMVGADFIRLIGCCSDWVRT